MTLIDMLLREIKEHQTALFFGAGGARCHLMPEHQLPDGNEMQTTLLKYHYGSSANGMNELKERFRRDFKIEGRVTPEIVWEKCLAAHRADLPWFSKIIQEMFGKNKYIPPNYKFIAWLHLMDERKINQVITTNFDEKIDDAYRLLQQRGQYSDTTVFSAACDPDYDHIPTNIRNTRIIYKLHGTLSKPYSIISSASEMERLNEKKYTALENIFKNNDLIIFLGYACNDLDIYNALQQISEGKPKSKVYWIKRSGLHEEDNAYKVLENFVPPHKEPKDFVIEMNSYDFLLNLFDHFVDREKINLSSIKTQTQSVLGKLSHDTEPSKRPHYSYSIPDIVYGEIKFPNEKGLREGVFKIINSFDVQRLRDIKQLSFAQYKYPSATHTRFSHSLGVAFLVSQALKNGNLKNIASKEDRNNTIYAAILHDVGHGPLGHILDKFYDRVGKSNEHEQFTEKFIDEGLFDLRDVLKSINVNVSEIKNRIMFNSKNKTMLRQNANKAYLSWLITDYALDLDRMDFILRDFTLTQRSFNSQYFRSSQQKLFKSTSPSPDVAQRYFYKNKVDEYINHLNVASHNELDEELQKIYPEDVKLLYVDPKKRTDSLNWLLDPLLELYCEMYLKVYYNDKVSSAEAMMAKALHIAYDIGDIDRSGLYKYTDSELFAYLEHLENDLIREIVSAVKYRRFLKPVVEFDLDTREYLSVVEIEERIENEFGLKKNGLDSLVVVHIPRKKQLRNLFIRTGDEITDYPNLSVFNDKLSNIKGKVFLNPKSKIFKKENNRLKLVELLENMNIKANSVKPGSKGQSHQTEI